MPLAAAHMHDWHQSKMGPENAQSSCLQGLVRSGSFSFMAGNEHVEHTSSDKAPSINFMGHLPHPGVANGASTQSDRGKVTAATPNQALKTILASDKSGGSV